MSYETRGARAYQDVFERQAGETAFLWHLRAVTVRQPHVGPADLARMEQRIDNHLEALMYRPDLAWEACEQELSTKLPGETFAAASIAFRRDEPAKVTRTLEAGLSNDSAFRGLVSAVGWLPETQSRAWVDRFLASPEPDRQYLAVAVCSIRSQDPAKRLNEIAQNSDCRAYPRLFARCLRLAGELKRVDLAPFVDAATETDDETVRFWALWSSILLGRRERAKELKPFVHRTNPWRLKAIELAFRVLPTESAREWINELVHDNDEWRHTVKAAAAFGDPDTVPWLIEAMQDPMLARPAGEAFATLTGLDLARHELAMTQPVAPLDLLDDQDPDVILEDEKLPWPDPDAVSIVWKRSAPRFRAGERYFLGRPIVPEHLRDVVANGYQRQRHAAALELALRRPDLPLPNTRARQVPI